MFRKDEFFNMIYPLYLGLQATHFKLWANQNHALKNSVRKNVEIDLIQFETYKMVCNTQQFVGKKPSKCLSVFDHFVGLALKG